MREQIGHDELRRVISYDPETGLFKWKTSLRHGTEGKVAGSFRKGRGHGRGYVYVRINNVSYLAHRLAWFYIKGRWPKKQVDHIDGNRSNNCFDNLRECSPLVNIADGVVRRVETGQTKGYTREPDGRYRAQAYIDGRVVNLGRYATEEEARAAFLRARGQIG